MPNVFGSDMSDVHAGGFIGAQPPAGNTPPVKTQKLTPMLRWARQVTSDLKRERQQVTEEMKRNVSLARGSTPWWKQRPKWKISTKLNKAFTVPATWTAILTDAQPSVTYVANDKRKQRQADILTAAFEQAYAEGNWAQVIHDAVFTSRVQKKGYLSLRPKRKGDRIIPELRLILGEQVYYSQDGRSVDDAETRYVEYRESYGSLCARFEGLRDKLVRKYNQPRTENDGENQSQLAPPQTYSFPTTSAASLNGPTYTTPNANAPAYAASPNPPEGSAGTAGMLVQEYWTSLHKEETVQEPLFLASGEPATRPKLFEGTDGKREPMRRIITEGGIIYELPESLVSAMTDGPIRVLSDRDCLEVITHEASYPLYPDGRLVVIVDGDVLATDEPNPLGYIPLADVSANSDPGGGQYGPSDVDLIADVYEQLVRLICLVYDTANLTGNAIWRVWEGTSLTNDDFTNAPGGILREEINSLKYSKREPGQELPSYILPYIKLLLDQIQDLSGLSDIVTGKMPPRMQVSTETITMQQEASGVRFRDALANLQRAMRTLGAHFQEFVARFYTTPVIVQIKNDQGILEPVSFVGAHLSENFSVEAKAGSRQPSGPSARLQTVLSLAGSGVPVDLDTVYGLLEELGSITSGSAMLRRIETYKNDPRQAWKVLGLAAPPQAKKPGSRRSKKKPAVA